MSDDLKKFGEHAAQEIGQRAIKSVVNNPQAAIATGVAASKAIGAAVVVAAPYVAAAAIGATVGWGLSKLLFGNSRRGGGGSSAATCVLRY